MFFNHMKHKACAASYAVALTASAWYTLGYLGFLVANKWAFFDGLLAYVPQLFIMLQWAPRPLMYGPGIDILGFIIGFVQIFVMASVVTWVAASLYEYLRK